MKEATGAVTVFAVLLLLLYDAIVWVAGGHEWTISHFLNAWAFDAHPMVMIGLGFVLGGFFIHFFRWAPGSQKG